MEFIIKTLTFPSIPGDTFDPKTREHSGRYVDQYNCRLSKHFTLLDFARSGRYMFNEYLIERLEAMFDYFPAIQGMYISSAYRLSQPGNYTSMHQRGGAIDIAWLDADGKRLDARYIAVVAAFLGFGGIAPLENPDGAGGHYTNSIHLDVRKEVWGSIWYGYERDLNGDGWFESFTHSGSAYKSPEVFCKWYNITEEEALAYLGTSNIKLSPVKKVILLENSKTTPVFKILTNTIFSDKFNVKYKLKCDDTELEKTTKIIENEQNYLTFKVADLVPGTSYSIEIELVEDNADKDNENKEQTGIVAGTVNFTTIQDFPSVGSLGKLSTKSTKNTPLEKYSIKFSIPESYQCFWESYWKSKHAKKYKGYTLSIIANGITIYTTQTADSPFHFTPKDYNIPFGTNIQIGLQTWINTDKKISDSDYECITSELVCSNPIYLGSAVPLIKRIYIKKDNNKYIRLAISDLKEVNWNG